jgi:signal transduction histidine kinase
MTTVRSVAARTALTIRCIVIAYTAVQVAIWHSFYAASPWRLAGPVVAVAWAGVIVTCLRRGWPGWRLAVLDTCVYLALALGAMSTVPAAMRGDTSNWLFIMMAGQLVVPAWFAPGRLVAPLAVASGAAYWASPAAQAGGVAGGSSPAAAGLLLCTVAAVAWCAAWSLYRWARAADAALALADRQSREQYVMLSRDIERREHERLLHDTVLNTLTALSRSAGGCAPGVVGRCRHDVTLMEYVLSLPPDADEAAAASAAMGPAAAGQPSALDQVARWHYGGMLAAIEAVASEMRDRGLTVHVDPASPAPASPAPAGADPAGADPDPAAPDPAAPDPAAPDPAAPDPAAPDPAGTDRPGDTAKDLPPATNAPGVVRECRWDSTAAVTAAKSHPRSSTSVPVVPVPVAVAIAHAVREALANVASHAGTGEAWVKVSLAAPDAEPGGVLVTVRDEGAGFDPSRVDPTRLGLRRSIVERIADWGGQASVRSAPGEGTEVSLRWPGPPDAGRPAVTGGASALAGASW